MRSQDPKLTALLQAWQRGEAGAADEVVPLVYAALHKIAVNRLRSERGGHTLQPTALVHEAWMRLSTERESGWQNREQFFAVAAKTMRHLLVDHARRRLAAKRGDGAPMAALDELADVIASPLPDQRLLDLNAALDQLAALDERQARIVELRFFAGLSIEETAGVLALSASTVKLEWATARAWLYREVQHELR
ncbi:MAG: sigma-70 family RNA polymerase sigma factor [Acidobacteria bacterium]|nr:sigma-70 family RNA polymerase sigma factor [Acidobacteriota bacterium]